MVHTQLDLAVCGFGACAVANGAMFCFCFPRTSLKEATQAAHILRGSALPVLPLAMIQHFNHPGPTKQRGHPKLKYKRGQLLGGQLLSLGHLCRVLAPMKVTPPNPGAPPGQKRSECEAEWGEPCLTVRNWGSFPVLRGLGQVVSFPLPPFSHTLDVQSHLLTVILRGDNRSGRTSKGER